MCPVPLTVRGTRGHLIVVLWLGVAAASSKSAASERRLSATDFRTFRGKLDPPAAGRGRLLEETSKTCERATGVRVLCPAKVDKMWDNALRDACTVDNNAGRAYNRTCPGPRATGGGTNPQHH